jgi:hypothetical protein
MSLLGLQIVAVLLLGVEPAKRQLEDMAPDAKHVDRKEAMQA